MRSFLFRLSLPAACSITASIFLVATYLFIPPARVQAATRDPLQWPFAPTSIWNMPIGSDAHYVDAHIGSRGFGTDIDWLIVTRESDPRVPTYMPATWGEGRCANTIPQQQAQWHAAAAEPLHIPHDLIIPDAVTSGGVYSTPNNSSAFLKPDGRTLVSFNATARCQPGGPLYGVWFGETDLYGDGIRGGHGGSGLSSIGGSIRTGELLNDQPIRHALKINIWANWMNFNETNSGKRWPATHSDSYAHERYKGTNPALLMGSLLALSPDVTPESLGITSTIGKKIFYALQNYGGYVADDTAWDSNALCVEQQADVEFQKVMGHPIANDQVLMADFNKMIAAVKVVENNSPTSIGGGGTPRVSMAPEFGVEMTTPQAATTPTTMPATPTPTAATPTSTASEHNSVVVNTNPGVQSTPTQKPTDTNNILATSVSRTDSSLWTTMSSPPWLFLPLALILLGTGWFWWSYRKRRQQTKVPDISLDTTSPIQELVHANNQSSRE